MVAPILRSQTQVSEPSSPDPTKNASTLRAAPHRLFQGQVASRRCLGRTSPSSWPFPCVMLPFWPIDWPKRVGTHAVLIAMF